jgi:hypothetical protein
LALVWCAPGLAAGQGMAPGQPAFGAFGSPMGNPMANPMANPYVNPFLNPYMTMFPTDRSDTLLYFWTAQQARGGLGSSALGSMGPGGAGTGLPGSGMAGGPGTSGTVIRPANSARAAQRPQGARFEASRPGSGGHVAGRFGEYPSFNDRARLASRFPAFGNMAVDAETGAEMAPGLNPAPNQEAPRYFNRYPSYNAYNGR